MDLKFCKWLGVILGLKCTRLHGYWRTLIIIYLESQVFTQNVSILGGALPFYIQYIISLIFLNYLTFIQLQYFVLRSACVRWFIHVMCFSIEHAHSAQSAVHWHSQLLNLSLLIWFLLCYLLKTGNHIFPPALYWGRKTYTMK